MRCGWLRPAVLVGGGVAILAIVCRRRRTQRFVATGSEACPSGRLVAPRIPAQPPPHVSVQDSDPAHGSDDRAVRSGGPDAAYTDTIRVVDSGNQTSSSDVLPSGIVRSALTGRASQ